MAVNLSKEAYRQTEVIREITPVHLLTEEESISSNTNIREVTPEHLKKEDDTINKAVRECTPVHIHKEQTDKRTVEKVKKTSFSFAVFDDLSFLKIISMSIVGALLVVFRENISSFVVNLTEMLFSSITETSVSTSADAFVGVSTVLGMLLVTSSALCSAIKVLRCIIR